MSSPDWFRWFPTKWASGVVNLTPEQRGVYIDIINVVLDRGACPEDYRFLAKVCNCRRPKIVRLVESLIESGKLQRLNGALMQGKAVAERRKSEQTLRKLAGNFDFKSHNYPPVFSENNDLASEIREEKIDSKRERDARARGFANSSGKGESHERHHAQEPGTIPDDWQPSAIDRSEAIRLGIEPGAIDREAEAFRDYYLASGRIKHDWPAAWRIHCRRAAAQPGRPGAAEPRRDRKEPRSVVAAVCEVIDLADRKMAAGD